MTSKLTREKAQWLHDACEEAAAAGIKLTMNPNELLMFTSYALAAMDSKPVAWRWRRGPDTRWHLASRGDLAGEVEPLYRHAQPAPDREQVRREHAEWSQATFGSVGPVGPLKHLSKEALEAAAEPGDLSEWADMQFLLWDAQRRAGITDEQITQAMIEKLAVNKQREWPAPKDGEPRLHIKEQPAPELKPVGYLFVSDQGAVAYSPTEWGMHGFRLIGQIYGDMSMELQPAPVVPEKATVGEMPFLGTSEGVYVRGWNDCRAAMLQSGNSPAQSDCCPAQNHASPEQNGDTPAQSQGWIPVSERMPEVEQEVLTINKMGHRFVSFFDKHSGLFFDRLDAPAACCIEHVLVTHWMPLPPPPTEVK